MRLIRSLCVTCLAVGVGASSSPPMVSFDAMAHRPLSFERMGLKTFVQTAWDNARQLAELEQSVEDWNAECIALSPADECKRRLIVLPLDERFDPPSGSFSRDHVQTGDKMSLPKDFWTAILTTQAPVPWLFQVSKLTSHEDDGETKNEDEDSSIVSSSNIQSVVQKCVGGAIDFRSPGNYVFLPHWMMLAMGLRPRDVVDVKLTTTTPPGSHVKLRPHTSEFLQIKNHQAVLETELKHYSALTQGATIPFDYNGKRWYFDVVDLRSAPRGERVPMAKVQDCDIAAEFVTAKDKLKNKKPRN
jgi:hypothetical protein